MPEGSTIPTVSSGALDFALATVLADRGDTDVLPIPHEYSALKDYWEPVRDFLSSEDVTQWRARPLRRCLAPKGDAGFRVVTQLDPLDHLLYTAAVFEIGQSLEGRRIDQSASRVFSWRFEPDVDNAKFFSQNIGHGEFLSHCLELSKQCRFVMELDIADFYPRIYLHRMENLLDSAPERPMANLIKSLLKQWNQNVSYGIPIGQQASRLLADTVISDVDAALIAEGARYCRFVDDYRFFCNTERECRHWMLRIAELLDRMHGLTLQPSKTAIQSSEQFSQGIRFFLDSSEQAEMEARISALVGEIEWEYGTIDFEDLEASDQALLLELDLPTALKEHLAGSRPRFRYMQSILMWLARTADTRALESVLDERHIEKFRPAVAALSRYIASLDLDEHESQLVSSWLGDALLNSSLGDSDYGRSWLLWAAREQDLLTEQALIELYRLHPDEFTRPAVALALGRKGAEFWFREQKTQAGAMSGWLRRAILAGSVALPLDERTHWLRSLPAFDVLETAVADKARGRPTTPFVAPA